MSTVIERVKAATAKDGRSQREALGMAHGRVWAMRKAEYGDYHDLVRIGGLDNVAPKTALRRALDPAQELSWGDLHLPFGEDESEEFCFGFIAGANEVMESCGPVNDCPQGSERGDEPQMLPRRMHRPA